MAIEYTTIPWSAINIRYIAQRSRITWIALWRRERFRDLGSHALNTPPGWNPLIADAEYGFQRTLTDFRRSGSENSNSAGEGKRREN
jgi:hypothetical protein